MADINISDIRKLTQESIKSIDYLIHENEYKDIYEKFNLKIIEKAKSGENSIRFDFVDTDLIETSQPKEEWRRVYIGIEGGYAEFEMFDYPLYLISKGFKVEIMNSQKRHGYKSKSYLISW